MKWLFLLVFLFASLAFGAEPYTAVVVRIPDGDTILVEHDRHLQWIRLNGVDCPEGGEPYTESATQIAKDLMDGKTVTIKPYTTDRRKRTIADVVLPNGTSPNTTLITSGHCRRWHDYSRTSK